ncbi:hypothetical protein BOTBODRAFT_26081 [Botryobasidium botryosum FD-172 SS1]|uniref:Rhamnose mutarotase n=1 Tax=Botryobasidium botryosum (strain FD-172 SS1) TaxID=930990 RepID=A0A067NCW6_BOTB1|nr:hypothetical protein BOTBODRAFT_26081 [Botryobasidium botryosum FD-172 SS1]
MTDHQKNTSTPSREAKRVCQVITIKAKYLDEYKQIHANAWPGVLDGLRRSHIIDFSIHFMPSPPYPATPQSTKHAGGGERDADPIAGLLITTFEYLGDDLEGDMARLAEDEETRRWWKLTDGMQKSLIEGATGSQDGPWWYECEEVFRME